MVAQYLETRPQEPVIYTAENPLIITMTETMTFKRCRLQWYLINKEHLAPRMEAPYFYTGRVVHRTLELWDDKNKNIEAVFMAVLHEEVEAYKERYKQNFLCDISSAELDELLALSHLPLCMVRNYKERWKQPLPNRFKMIQPEQTFLVSIPGVDNVKFEGTLDGLALDVKTGKLVVVERKTYDKRPKIESLANAEQFVGYCWILTQAFPQHEVGGVLYDGLWKREVAPRGRQFNDLFMREWLPKSADEIKAFEGNLIEVAQEMVNSPRIYPTRVWQGCYDDKGFDRLCSAIHKNEDVEFTREEYYVIKPPRWFEEEQDEDDE